MPTVLIADDDPVSLNFLQAALEGLGCATIVAANGALAIEAVESRTPDLLMLDLHMPDVGGAGLLRALRERGVHAAAVATSAELDAAAHAVLRTAGFVDTLPKPATLASIENVVARHLGLTPRGWLAQLALSETGGTVPILDDASALAAIGGDRAAVTALRGLLAGELDALEGDPSVANARSDPAALGAKLHRLRASSGFCGATALGAAALRLQQSLRGDARDVPAAMADFVRTCRETRQALAADG